MEQRTCVVGLDMGTTSVKAVGFDVAGAELARAEQGLTLWHDEPGAAEQDPEEVGRAVGAVLGEVSRQVGGRGYAVERVGLSAAMHSLIPVGADERPLGRAMLWMDTRARRQAEELWASAAGRAIYERSGTPIHAMTPLAKLIWLRQQRPAVFGAAARFVSLKEWAWHHWFGAWQVDASIASATGLYDLARRAWDAEALGLAGVDAGRLSAVVPTVYTRAGVSDPDLIRAGLSPQTIFNVGASDGVLANLGVGAVGPDLLVLTIGTSLAVRSGSPRILTDPPTRLFCYVLDADRYIVGGPSNSGGIVLDWLYRKVLGGPAVDPEAKELPAGFVQLLAAAGGAHDPDLLCLPYVTGERAPLWEADARGVLFGLEVGHTAAHVMRAAVEGIVFNAYWIASRLIERQGPPRAVVASGHVLEADWIRQLVADVFGLPVRFLGGIDASATGAAALANIAAGAWSWEEAARRLGAGHVAVAQPAPSAPYQAQYQRFRRLAEALRAEMGVA